MPSTFGIVDLFAGPGGLGEGFASLVEDGHAPFRIGISVEKEPSAHRTLTLRTFLREYRAGHGFLPKEFIDFHAGLASEPDWSAVDAEAWQHAIDEARALEHPAVVLGRGEVPGVRARGVHPRALHGVGQGHPHGGHAATRPPRRG